MAGDIVETKVGGKVIRKEVPAGATQEQIRAAFRAEMRKHGINVADQAVIDAPKPKLGNVLKAAAQPTLSAYNPGWSEKAQQKISDLLMGLGMERVEALNLGKNLTGFLNDWTPVGNVTGVADADNDLERQLSMLPLPGPVRGAVGQALRGIKAFHGSPHDFDRFDLSKIGTGEGAQAYGHGLYFAENEATARKYRDDLSPPSARRFEGERLLEGAEDKAADILLAEGNRADALAYVDRLRGSVMADPQWLDQLAGAIGRFDERLIRTGDIGPQGRMYEVNINADPDSLLDWDAPLKVQPETVQRAIIEAARDTQPKGVLGSAVNSQLRSGDLSIPGEVAYTGLNGLWDKARVQASSTLRERGIPGIKYLDQGSRTAGQGSRNFVVFDDKLVDIMRKY